MLKMKEQFVGDLCGLIGANKRYINMVTYGDNGLP